MYLACYLTELFDSESSNAATNGTLKGVSAVLVDVVVMSGGGGGDGEDGG